VFVVSQFAIQIAWRDANWWHFAKLAAQAARRQAVCLGVCG
jgi:hypothetical protein